VYFVGVFLSLHTRTQTRAFRKPTQGMTMSSNSEPKLIASELLKIMIESGRAGAGASIRTHRLQQKFGLLRHAEVFESGLRFAIAQTWLELSKDGTLILTAKGLAEA
jgi:hypothetical protein